MEGWKHELNKEYLSDLSIDTLNHLEYKLNLHIYYLNNQKVLENEDIEILKRYKKNMEIVKLVLSSKENKKDR